MREVRRKIWERRTRQQEARRKKGEDKTRDREETKRQGEQVGEERRVLEARKGREKGVLDMDGRREEKEKDRGNILLGFLLAVAYPANCGAHSWRHRASHGQPSQPCNWSKREQVVCVSVVKLRLH